jgi:NTP pyrophosphatase (non-canonical NTP hydrolase)
MDLNEYQKEALVTWGPGRNTEHDILRLVLGVCGESGEIAEKFKKYLRGDTELDKDLIAKEIGDVLWYLSVLSHELGFEFNEIGQRNIDKLRDRQKRNIIKGSGDER